MFNLFGIGSFSSIHLHFLLIILFQFPFQVNCWISFVDSFTETALHRSTLSPIVMCVSVASTITIMYIWHYQSPLSTSMCQWRHRIRCQCTNSETDASFCLLFLFNDGLEETMDCTDPDYCIHTCCYSSMWVYYANFM